MLACAWHVRYVSATEEIRIAAAAVTRKFVLCGLTWSLRLLRRALFHACTRRQRLCRRRGRASNSLLRKAQIYACTGRQRLCRRHRRANSNHYPECQGYCCPCCHLRLLPAQHASFRMWTCPLQPQLEGGTEPQVKGKEPKDCKYKALFSWQPSMANPATEPNRGLELFSAFCLSVAASAAVQSTGTVRRRLKPDQTVPAPLQTCSINTARLRPLPSKADECMHKYSQQPDGHGQVLAFLDSVLTVLTLAAYLATFHDPPDMAVFRSHSSCD